jgi:prepilin-type N-terminal cleavage/methylation domain-containing protein/prepilin-type processing-associated H-X9-DG protein
MSYREKAFTLVELLVVIAIIGVLAAVLFPVFSAAKRSAKRTTCLSNTREIGQATMLYLSDNDDVYPQTRQSSADPALQDLSGSIDEPIFQQVFQPIQGYIGSRVVSRQPITSLLFACPEDQDPFGQRCLEIDPDAPDVTSYVVNAYFVFGLNQSSVTTPSNTIYFSERRSASQGDVDPFCDDVYHPWFNSSNLFAPEDEMDPLMGAIATTRHSGVANYDFVDGHAKALHWGETYAPPVHNLHLVQQE